MPHDTTNLIGAIDAAVDALVAVSSMADDLPVGVFAREAIGRLTTETRDIESPLQVSAAHVDALRDREYRARLDVQTLYERRAYGTPVSPERLAEARLEVLRSRAAFLEARLQATRQPPAVQPAGVNTSGWEKAVGCYPGHRSAINAIDGMICEIAGAERVRRDTGCLPGWLVCGHKWPITTSLKRQPEDLAEEVSNVLRSNGYEPGRPKGIGPFPSRGRAA